jgi:hypothetical protein
MNPRPTLASSDQEIVDFVSSWIGCLITDGYEVAISLLDEPIDDNRRKWTKLEWDRELECYGEGAAITSPLEVPDLRTDVYLYNDGSGFAVDYDLPVNGTRSDHTLQFDFRDVGSRMNVALDDLHVL